MSGDRCGFLTVFLAYLILVGASASCGSSDKGSQSLTTQQVTTTAPVTCADIAFAPQSDNIATHIVATGTDCAEAQALVRKVAAEHNFTTGPREFASGTFECSVVTEEAAVPVGHYACMEGAKRVSWDKS